jgi:hypothetical protein
VPDVVPRYLCKFDDTVHVSEHELGDVDCELTIDFRPLVPNLSRGEAELLLAFIEVGPENDNTLRAICTVIDLMLLSISSIISIYVNCG